MATLGFRSRLTKEGHIIMSFSVAVTFNRDGLAICGRLFTGPRLFTLNVSIPVKVLLGTLVSIWSKIRKVVYRGLGRGSTKASLRHGMTLKESQENRDLADSEYCHIGEDAVDLELNQWR